MYVTLVVAVLVLWAWWGLFDKKALGEANYLGVLLTNYTYSIPIFGISVIVLHFAHRNWRLDPHVFVWSALCSLCTVGALTAYLAAMKRTEASLVLGATASYPIVTQLILIIFVNERVPLLQLIGSAIVVSGLIVLALSGGDKKGLAGKDRLFVWTCVAIATLLWGIWAICYREAAANNHNLEAYLGKCLTDGALLLVLLPFLKDNMHSPSSKPRLWGFCGLSSLCIYGGSLGFVTALRYGSTGYVTVITSCYPALMYVFAVLFLKEKRNTLRALGILLVVAGGIAAYLGRS